MVLSAPSNSESSLQFYEPQVCFCSSGVCVSASRPSWLCGIFCPDWALTSAGIAVRMAYAFGAHGELVANYLQRESRLEMSPEDSLAGVDANYLFDKATILFVRFES